MFKEKLHLLFLLFFAFVLSLLCHQELGKLPSLHRVGFLLDNAGHRAIDIPGSAQVVTRFALCISINFVNVRKAEDVAVFIDGPLKSPDANNPGLITDEQRVGSLLWKEGKCGDSIT